MAKSESNFGKILQLWWIDSTVAWPRRRCLPEKEGVTTGINCVLAPADHLSVYTPMTSLVAILDLKGKPLIQRSYRDDVPSSCIERFLPLVLEIEEDGQQVTPCFSNQGINYMHIRHSNLYRE